MNRLISRLLASLFLTAFVFHAVPARADDAAAAKKCCKTCSADTQACGDACIAKDKKCAQKPGCACGAEAEKKCCKKCSGDSQACGDTCIPKAKKCSQPAGCAC